MNSLPTETSLNTLDLLILGRLLAGKPTSAGAKKDVGAVAAAHLTPGEWTALFDSHWIRLHEAGMIGPDPTTKPPKKPSKTPPKALVLTDAGRRRALDFLGATDVPAGTTWAKLQSDFLVPKAIGLKPGSKEAAALKKVGPLQLSIVLRDRHAPAGTGMTAKKLLALIAWQAIGVESEADFNAENVIQQLVFHCAPKKTTAAKVLGALAAASVGSVKTGAPDLRAAALRKWLLAPSDGEGRPPEPPADESLESFAGRVLAAARRCPAAGRFGDNKVFISHVWRQLNGGPAADDGLTNFKQRLIDANREGFLQLSRADLVEAMNPADVEESTTAYGNATFHFVRIMEN